MKNIALIFFSIAFSVLIFEFVILELKYDDASNRDISIEEAGIDINSDLVVKEDLEVYQIEPHPWRWFNLARDYQGQFHRTNSLGYRFDMDSIDPDRPTVGFFGGSTMYSVFTVSEFSIPELVQETCGGNRINALNFGVGGYSTSAEIGAFTEAIRHLRLDHAIFYDGANEIGRYIENVQSNGPDNAVYAKIGFPYDETRFSEINFNKNYNAKHMWLKDFNIGKLIHKFIRKNIYGSDTVYNENIIVDDLTTHPDNIIFIYEENMETLKNIASGQGITVDFFWQPSVFSKSPKSEREISLSDAAPAVQTLLHREVDRRVGESAAVIDLTGVFDGQNSRVFVDAVHLGKSGNQIVANSMIEKSSFLSSICLN